VAANVILLLLNTIFFKTSEVTRDRSDQGPEVDVTQQQTVSQLKRLLHVK